MSEDYLAQSTFSSSISRDSHERWRLLKDKITSRLVTVGGLSIIFAVLLIFFYLLYVVFPLLLPSHAESVNRYDVPALSLGNTVFLAMEEQNEVAVRYTDTGKAVFFNVADGSTVLIENIAIPDQAEIISFAHGGFDKGVVAYGLADGRVLAVKHDYKLTYSNGKRKITPFLTYPLGKEALLVDSNKQALKAIEIKLGDKNNVFVAKTADNRIILNNFSKKVSLFDEESGFDRSETSIVEIGNEVDFL